MKGEEGEGEEGEKNLGRLSLVALNLGLLEGLADRYPTPNPLPLLPALSPKLPLPPLSLNLTSAPPLLVRIIPPPSGTLGLFRKIPSLLFRILMGWLTSLLLFRIGISDDAVGDRGTGMLPSLFLKWKGISWIEGGAVMTSSLLIVVKVRNLRLLTPLLILRVLLLVLMVLVLL